MVRFQPIGPKQSDHFLEGEKNANVLWNFAGGPVLRHAGYPAGVAGLAMDHRVQYRDDPRGSMGRIESSVI